MPKEEGKTEGGQEAQEEWKVRFKDGTVFAPVTYENLVEWFNSGQIDAETPVAENALTAEWVTFKDTEGFATAKAAKEGEQVFCTSCGSPWPVGTKFCTKCGTNLKTGEKLSGVGEKKPERVFRLRAKTKEGAPEEVPVTEPAEAVEVPAGEETPAVVESEAAAEPEAAEAVVPVPPAKRGKKKIVKLVVAVAIVAVAVKFLAPDLASDVLDKLKSLVGAKKKTVSPEERKQEQRWAGVRDDVRDAVESLQERASVALTTVPFSQSQRGAVVTEIGDFMKAAVDDFTDEEAFISLAGMLAEGNVARAASFLEEEKELLGENVTPRIHAIHGAIQILLGKEEKGTPLLASAAEERSVARLAAGFCRAAMEGCLERFLPPQGRRDPWDSVSAILGINKEVLTDEFLARRCGKVLSTLSEVEALTGEGPGEPFPFLAKKTRTKAFVGLFNRWDLSAQAGLIELGKTDPAKRPSVLNQKPARVAYALRLMAPAEEAVPGEGDQLLEVLQAGLSADPDNAFYNYALAAVYLESGKEQEAIREVVAGNAKSAYQDYAKERMLGLAKVLDSRLPYTSAVMKVSCPQFAAMVRSSQGLLSSAGSAFRVGRRDEAFEMVAEWRKALDRLKGEVCTFEDGLTLVNALIPLGAAEADFYKRDGKETESWQAREALAKAWRHALAVQYGATYGLTAEVFVKEVLSEGEIRQELEASSPKEAMAALWEKAALRLDAMLKQEPARTPLQGVNLQDPNYAAAVKSLNAKRYETAVTYAGACLTQNPRHLWALKVMQQAASRAESAAESAGPKAVVYRVTEQRDLSLGPLKRLEYEIEIGKDATREQAVATVRSALQGFWKREKADAVRIYVTREGSALPYVRLTWAPGGDWAKAKRGTPYDTFREGLKVFE